MNPKKRYKIVIYIPEKDSEKLKIAIGNAGAGVIGNYTHCMFTVKGIGRFRPNKNADPAIGEPGEIENVPEDRIETMCSEEKIKDVLQAIRDNHPYEEPATDVYPIEVIEELK